MRNLNENLILIKRMRNLECNVFKTAELFFFSTKVHMDTQYVKQINRAVLRTESITNSPTIKGVHSEN